MTKTNVGDSYIIPAGVTIVAMAILLAAVALAVRSTLQTQIEPTESTPCLQVTQTPVTRDLGEYAYLTKPNAIVRAIRAAEGVPSYGLMYLANVYGSHRSVPEKLGRRRASDLLHITYKKWVERGRPRPFLTFLRDSWAPLHAGNDPTGLNNYWLTNVKSHLGRIL